MNDPNEWDAPDPPRLLVSAKRVAAELDIPIWKAHEVCWCLDRRFYSPGQSHFRVTVASLEALKDLLNLGLDLAGARAVMWQFKTRGDLPPPDLSLEEAKRIYWLARRRW
ncbi:hypothetical protein [Nocardioides jejuensis]|uniref:Uncharacterized protein n=1 Tax=Nocardioides jejuensis TaxID=2502782 RepID=A0A4V2P006_9ACTN|nr:hypothetical protein [Nocardioides jejuensis]TCJ31062.1 hypothetical protein EPD65_00350 [Nocardioides jejuensis]